MNDDDNAEGHQEHEEPSDNTGQVLGFLALFGFFGPYIQNLSFFGCLLLSLPALIFLPAIICYTSYSVWQTCFAYRPITGVVSLISKIIGTAYLLIAFLAVAFDVWIVWDNWHSDFKTFCILIGGLNLIASAIRVVPLIGSEKQHRDPTCMIHLIGFLLLQVMFTVIVYRVSV